MKKIMMIAAVALASIGFATAQNVNYRVEAGANFANQDVKLKGITIDAKKMLIGYRAGAAAEINFAENFYVAPGLTFKMNGTKLSSSKLGSCELFIHYASLPINVGFRTNITDELGLSLEAGPYLAYAMAGREKYDDQSFDLFAKDDRDTPINRFDWGLGASAALHYNNLFFRLGTEFGMMNIHKDGNKDKSMKNFDFFTTIGYRF